MSIKHRTQQTPEKIIEVKDYNLSKHTRNNYLSFLKTASKDELLKEHNKLNLLMKMMRVGHLKGVQPYTKGEDNISIIKYKYNVLCQEITNRQLHILKVDYNKSKSRSYKSK